MSQVTLLVPKGCVMRMSLDAAGSQDISCSPKTEATTTAHAIETMEALEMRTEKRQRRKVVASESKETTKRAAKTPPAVKKLRLNVQKEEEMKLLEEEHCDDIDTVPESEYLELKRELRAAQEELKAMKKRELEVKDATVATEEGIVGAATYFSLHLEGEMAVAKKRIKDLEALNVRLQNSLMSKLLAAEGKLIYATASDVAVDLVPAERHLTEPHGSDPPLRNIDEEGPCQTDILPESEVSNSESVEQEDAELCITQSQKNLQRKLLPAEEFQYQVLTRLTVLRMVQQQQGELLMSLAEKVSRQQRSRDQPVLLNSPFRDYGSLKRFDATLTGSTKEAFIQELASKGGANAVVCTRRLLKMLLTNDLAREFSWFGKKGKHAFSLLRVASCIVSAVKSTHDATDYTIEEAMREWLRHAPARHKAASRKAQAAQ